LTLLVVENRRRLDMKDRRPNRLAVQTYSRKSPTKPGFERAAMARMIVKNYRLSALRKLGS
jgi:hypothetical protein